MKSPLPTPTMTLPFLLTLLALTGLAPILGGVAGLGTGSGVRR